MPHAEAMPQPQHTPHHADTATCHILFTSDTHGCLTPTDYATGSAGAACLADFSGELTAMRAEGPTLFLDGGDTLQGTPLLRYWLMERDGVAADTVGKRCASVGDTEMGRCEAADGKKTEPEVLGATAGRGDTAADAWIEPETTDAAEPTPHPHPTLDRHADEARAARSAVNGPQFANPVATAFGALGLDAFTLGNHDFNYGRDVLADHVRAMSKAGAVCVCANVHDERGELMIRPHVILERGGLRIGITGVVTDHVTVWEAPEHLADLVIGDALTAAREQAAILRDTCDITCCLYHGGFEEDLASGRLLSSTTENRACAMARELDFDVLLTGHQHKPVAQVRFGNTLAAQPPANALRAVRVDVQVDLVHGDACGDGTPLASDGAHAVHGQTASSHGPNPATVHTASRLVSPCAHTRSPQGIASLNALAPLDTACASWLNAEVGTLAHACPAQDKLTAALGGDALADLINEAQLDATGALISCTSLGNDPVGLPCVVTRRDICAAYRFMNTLMVIEVTPAQLKQALERCAAYLELDEAGAPHISRAFLEPKVEHYNYDFYRGVSYTVDLARPVGERVLRMTLADGRPLPDRFALALNDYRASGTGGYEVFADCPLLSTAPNAVPVVLEHYIARRPGCSAQPCGGVSWSW